MSLDISPPLNPTNGWRFLESPTLVGTDPETRWQGAAVRDRPNDRGLEVLFAPAQNRAAAHVRRTFLESMDALLETLGTHHFVASEALGGLRLADVQRTSSGVVALLSRRLVSREGVDTIDTRQLSVDGERMILQGMCSAVRPNAPLPPLQPGIQTLHTYPNLSKQPSPNSLPALAVGASTIQQGLLALVEAQHTSHAA
jgi:hypothetical protein